MQAQNHKDHEQSVQLQVDGNLYKVESRVKQQSHHTLYEIGSKQNDLNILNKVDFDHNFDFDFDLQKQVQGTHSDVVGYEGFELQADHILNMIDFD